MSLLNIGEEFEATSSNSGASNGVRASECFFLHSLTQAENGLNYPPPK